MNDHISEKQWAAHVAYYDRAMRSLLELIQGTAYLMQGDGLTEVAVSLGLAALQVEDAWAALLREHASSIIAHKEHGEPSGTEGHME
jgi:hypothetical protein